MVEECKTTYTFLRKYLENCKKKINDKNLLISIGSEACDPDSFVASIAMAIHEDAIPVINMSRKIFEAKGDLTYLRSVFGIELDDLIYLERPKGRLSFAARTLATVFRIDDILQNINEKNMKLILVDHHRAVEELRHCEIDMIVDHHVLGPGALVSRRIYVDIDVGSCCTLVSKFIGHSLMGKEEKNALFGDPEFCKQLARMLAIPILLDTNRFKKVTSHFDRGEFKKLTKIGKIKKSVVAKHVKGIKHGRKNDNKLDTETILLKDFKKFDVADTVFGYSTVKYSFEEWARRDSKNVPGSELEATFHAFRRDHGLDFLLVNRKAGANRYLIMINFPFERRLARMQSFEPAEFEGLHYYSISVELSRKVLVPIIKELLNDIFNSECR